MNQLRDERFIGERALFQSYDLSIDHCIFDEGESPLKESKKIEITNTFFKWKYPLWYCTHINVKNSVFFEMARAGIWYSDHLDFYDFTVAAPKSFRRCHNVKLEKVTMPNAQETLWFCKDVTLKDVQAKGDYFAMGSEDMTLEDFSLIGNYSFDGVKNLTIKNSKILSKDAFWNCENVRVENSYISGEYLGWNAKDVTFIDCTIESLQGLCYMENVVLINCRLIHTDLAFEYSTVEAQVTTRIDSVKNPISGMISAAGIGEIIFDNPEMKQEHTTISIKE